VREPVGHAAMPSSRRTGRAIRGRERRRTPRQADGERRAGHGQGTNSCGPALQARFRRADPSYVRSAPPTEAAERSSGISTPFTSIRRGCDGRRRFRCRSGAAHASPTAVAERHLVLVGLSGIPATSCPRNLFRAVVDLGSAIDRRIHVDGERRATRQHVEQDPDCHESARPTGECSPFTGLPGATARGLIGRSGQVTSWARRRFPAIFR
jgi:hypothetical protein